MRRMKEAAGQEQQAPATPAEARGALRRWLGAERRDETEAAESALGLLMRALPELAPSPGFVQRVQRAIRQPAEAGFWHRWAEHWGLRAALLLAGLQTALVAVEGWTWARPVLGELGFEGVLVAAVQMAALGLVDLLELARASVGVAEIARSASRLASDPQVAAGAVFAWMVSAAAFLSLARMMPRRWERDAL